MRLWKDYGLSEKRFGKINQMRRVVRAKIHFFKIFSISLIATT
jgi:hypothetical protein